METKRKQFHQRQQQERYYQQQQRHYQQQQQQKELRYKNDTLIWHKTATLGPFVSDFDDIMGPDEIRFVECYQCLQKNRKNNGYIHNIKTSDIIRFDPPKLIWTKENVTTSGFITVNVHDSFPLRYLNDTETICDVRNSSRYHNDGDGMDAKEEEQTTSIATSNPEEDKDAEWLRHSHYQAPPMPQVPPDHIPTPQTLYRMECHPNQAQQLPEKTRVVPSVLTYSATNITRHFETTTYVALHVHRSFPDDVPIRPPNCSFRIEVHPDNNKQQHQKHHARNTRNDNQRVGGGGRRSSQHDAYWWINCGLAVVFVWCLLWMFRPLDAALASNNKHRTKTTRHAKTKKGSSRKHHQAAAAAAAAAGKVLKKKKSTRCHRHDHEHVEDSCILEAGGGLLNRWVTEIAKVMLGRWIQNWWNGSPLKKMSKLAPTTSQDVRVGEEDVKGKETSSRKSKQKPFLNNKISSILAEEDDHDIDMKQQQQQQYAEEKKKKEEKKVLLSEETKDWVMVRKGGSTKNHTRITTVKKEDNIMVDKHDKPDEHDEHDEYNESDDYNDPDEPGEHDKPNDPDEHDEHDELPTTTMRLPLSPTKGLSMKRNNQEIEDTITTTIIPPSGSCTNSDKDDKNTISEEENNNKKTNHPKQSHKYDDHHNEFVLLVDGMTCQGCERVVRNAILAGATAAAKVLGDHGDNVTSMSVVASARDGTVIIRSSCTRLDVLAVAGAIQDVGFDVYIGPNSIITPSASKQQPLHNTPVGTTTTQEVGLIVPENNSHQNASTTRESSLSLIDELRAPSEVGIDQQHIRTVRRYRCHCGSENCICSNRPIHKGDPGVDISLVDLCKRLESSLGGSFFGAVTTHQSQQHQIPVTDDKAGTTAANASAIGNGITNDRATPLLSCWNNHNNYSNTNSSSNNNKINSSNNNGDNWTSNTSNLVDWIQSSDGGSTDFRQQLATMPIPCDCGTVHNNYHRD